MALPLGLLAGLTTTAQADVQDRQARGVTKALDLPTSPGGLSALAVTDTTIKIGWTHSTAPGGIAYYTVYRDGHSQGTTTETSFTATQLNVATEYSFSVVARGNNGVEGYSSQHFRARTTGTIPAPPANPVKMGVFPEDGHWSRNFDVKNVVTNGSAGKLTHLTYASGKIQNGKCAVGDTYRALERTVPAEQSVDGQGDSWDQPLSGHINQLRKLKKLHPQLKILWSFGGSEYSAGFPQALQNPSAFAASCAQLINDRRWAGVFDGIDLHWELPGTCPVTAACETGGPHAVRTLAQAARTALGEQLVTATIYGTSGLVFDNADHAGAAQHLDWINVKSYDYYTPTGYQGRHASLHAPMHGWVDELDNNAHRTYRELTARGVHPNKIVFGVASHARGWEGVRDFQPHAWASGPAYGTFGVGLEDYRNIKTRCPGARVAVGHAYALCGIEWWSYDNPATVAEKMAYAKQYGLGGAFLSNLRGDTDNAELLTAIDSGLR
ncbi:glycosyl hydrolase family 18 protein [Streptomyces sp. NPDC005953]|uniref:glycoside hydrolase family 18 protein n=1 Tax=Streptomyces sp. NPDC005953 TaxID=3156719 RepID=UPI0033EF9238